MVLLTKGHFCLRRLWDGESNQYVMRQNGLEKRTIAIDPQQRAAVLPFSKFSALNEPCCCSIMLSLTRSIMIYRRVGWREPCSKFLLYLVVCGACQRGRPTMVRSRSNERCCSSITLPITCTLSSTRPATSKIFATAIRLSSFVSESSRRSASSTLVFPLSFFKNFSAPKSAKKED
jgi:hypothetical protein